MRETGGEIIVSLPDLFGLVGSAMVIMAYFAVARGQLSANGWLFYLANLVGACLILISLYWAWNLPAAVVEIFWGAISIYGLARVAYTRPR
jgi:hypothetical protein